MIPRRISESVLVGLVFVAQAGAQVITTVAGFRPNTRL